MNTQVYTALVPPLLDSHRRLKGVRQKSTKRIGEIKKNLCELFFFFLSLLKRIVFAKDFWLLLSLSDNDQNCFLES